MQKITVCALRSLAAPIGAFSSIALFTEILQEKGFVALVLGSAYAIAFLILHFKPSINRLVYTLLTTTLSIFATTVGGTIPLDENIFNIIDNLIKASVVTTVTLATLPLIWQLCIPGFVVFFILDFLFVKYFHPARSSA